MELKKLDVKVKCDNGVCANLADYAVKRSGTPLVRELHLCKDCLKELSELYRSEEASARKSKAKGGKHVGTNMGNGDK